MVHFQLLHIFTVTDCYRHLKILLKSQINETAVINTIILNSRICSEWDLHLFWIPDILVTILGLKICLYFNCRQFASENSFAKNLRSSYFFVNNTIANEGEKALILKYFENLHAQKNLQRLFPSFLKVWAVEPSSWKRPPKLQKPLCPFRNYNQNCHQRKQSFLALLMLFAD